MIMIDSSALVDSLCGTRASEDRLNDFMAAGESFLLSTITLYEWTRGPRSEDELFWRELLFPDHEAAASTRATSKISPACVSSNPTNSPTRSSSACTSPAH